MNNLFAYVGPETIMPLASVLAAILGGFMFVGRSIRHYIVRAFQFITFRKKSESTSEG